MLVKKTKTSCFLFHVLQIISSSFFFSLMKIPLRDCSVFWKIPPTKGNTLLTCSFPGTQFLNAPPFIFYQNTFHDLNKEISILFLNKIYGHSFERWLFSIFTLEKKYMKLNWVGEMDSRQYWSSWEIEFIKIVMWGYIYVPPGAERTLWAITCYIINMLDFYILAESRDIVRVSNRLRNWK